MVVSLVVFRGISSSVANFGVQPAIDAIKEFEKERTWPKIVLFFFLSNWICGVSASENRQNRVSHGESVRVGSSGPEWLSRWLSGTRRVLS